MKKLTLIALAAIATVTLAQEPEAPKAAAQSKGYYRNPAAGLLEKKGEGGSLLVLNLADYAGDLLKTAAKMQMFFSSSVEVAKGEKEDCAMKTAFKAIAEKKGVAVIALSKDGTAAPSIVVCPEDHVAVINIDRLSKDASPEILDKRVTKEIWRSAGLILGGFASDHPCALKAVNSLEDLDKACLDMTCPPVNFKVGENARKIGIAPIGMVPYGVAVKQGWAPAPTNDIQKAIWEKVKAEKEAKTEAAEAAPPAPAK